MEKKELLYEGKAKKVYATDDASIVLVDYKDDATAGNGAKKGTIRGKGVVNNRVTNSLMKMLEAKGIYRYPMGNLGRYPAVLQNQRSVSARSAG